jgi:hypothetical protein
MPVLAMPLAAEEEAEEWVEEGVAYTAGALSRWHCNATLALPFLIYSTSSSD